MNDKQVISVSVGDLLDLLTEVSLHPELELTELDEILKQFIKEYNVG